MLVIFRILKLVYRKHKYRVIAGNISVIGSAFTALAIPQIIGMGVNSLVDSGSDKFESVYLLSLVLLLAGIGRGLFSYGQTYFGDSVAQRVAFDIRNAYFSKLQHLSFAFHDKQSTGSLMSRSTADVEGMRMFISMGAVRSGFIISMIIDKEWAESFWGPSKAENQQTSNETVTLNQKQISLIEGMIAEGQLDIKLNENKAYILKELWEAMKYDSKEDFTAGLSIYIQNKKNNNRFYCTVFDIYSGKRLAKYEGRRFEVFNGAYGCNLTRGVGFHGN